MTFFYSGGKYVLPVHLEPKAMTMFDVGEIIMEQKPDADGNVIPANVTEGSAQRALLSGAHKQLDSHGSRLRKFRTWLDN